MIANLAQLFFTKAKQHPHKTALLFPENERIASQWSFEDLMVNAEIFATGLRSSGFKRGDRIIWLAPLSPATYYFTISCLIIGAVPVFIEGGLTPKLLKKCIKQARAKAIISSQAFYRYLIFFPEIWLLKKYSVEPRSISIRCLVRDFEGLRSNQGNLEFADLNPEDLCLLTFTTGSTGVPKAAERTLKCLLAQHLLSKKYWPETSDEVDMPVFPNVVFQNLLCGITTVLPRVNFQQLKEINPAVVVDQIQRDQITRLSGSPKFLEQICDYILEHQIQVQVKNLIVGGAPVSKRLAKKIEKAFPQSQNFVVYGSTEVEPIAFAPLWEVLRDNQVGYFVGLPLREIQVQTRCPQTNMLAKEGEIWVSGPHVVEKYFCNEAATHATKHRDEHGKIWHRTGDWGRITENGILLTGRVCDLLRNHNSNVANYLVESELENLNFVDRASVLQINNQTQVCLQKASNCTISPSALENVLQKYDLTRTRIRLFNELPVDPRHNSKIDRQSLRCWIEDSETAPRHID
jgi:acyl-CoA synthetase (AMP-forming)/AMP-acid ligase II